MEKLEEAVDKPIGSVPFMQVLLFRQVNLRPVMMVRRKKVLQPLQEGTWSMDFSD